MVWDFLAKHGITIAFYALVIILLIVYRKKFEFQAKIIALRKTKFGLKFLDRMGKKHGESLKILGMIGIGVGFMGMIAMVYLLIKSFFDLFTNPSAPAAISPLLPGVTIPGSAISIPLWVIIPLFFVVLIHEAGHGLVSRAWKVPIKSTGIVFFGPLAGAFVEPDDKKLLKASDTARFSVFAAGPFANAVTAALVLLLMTVALNPLSNSMIEPNGFSIGDAVDGLPTDLSGLPLETPILAVNGETAEDYSILMTELEEASPGDAITLTTEDGETYTIETIAHPDDAEKAYIGANNILPEVEKKASVPQWSYLIVNALVQFFFWIFLLSVGLGAFNLLPLGPVDGGQMARLALTRMYGDKKGMVIFSKVTGGLFILIMILLFTPILRAIFGF